MSSASLIRRALILGALAVFAAGYYVAMMRWTWPWRPATWIYYFSQPVLRHAATALAIGACVLVPLEFLARRHDQQLFRPGLLTDILHATLSVLFFGVPLYFLTEVIGMASLDATADFVTRQPRWVQIGGALVFREFLVYWSHRTTHMISFLWRFHEVHHSSTSLDWLSTYRRHPVDLLWVALFLAVPLGLTGFQAVDVAFVYVAAEAWALYIHSNTRWRFRFFGPVIVSAEYHHWHHVSARQDHDKNYGEFTGIFDVLFGTYLLPEDRRPDEYGTSGNLPDDFVGQLFLRRRNPSLRSPSSRRRNPSLRSPFSRRRNPSLRSPFSRRRNPSLRSSMRAAERER